MRHPCSERRVQRNKMLAHAATQRTLKYEIKLKRSQTVWFHIWYYGKGKAGWETDQRFSGAGRSTGRNGNHFGGWWSCLCSYLRWLPWVLCSLKLKELNMSKSRFTECRIDSAFHNSIGNSFFPMMRTQRSLYGVKQGSLTSLTLVALTLACGCPWGGLPDSSLF